jgi:outer membrane protein assembly factor BamA
MSYFKFATWIFILPLLNFGQIDTLKYLKISETKRLSPEDLANKKEGVYATGIPNLSSDPVNGFGAGAETEIFFNGKRTDSTFAYTPYKSCLTLGVFYTTKHQGEVFAAIDAPYIFNTLWRLRADAAVEVNPNVLYFGNTVKTLEPLSYYPNNDSTQAPVTNVSYSDYEHSLTGPKEFYNTYLEKEFVGNISIERSIFEGKARTLLGFELTNMSNTTPLNPNSKLHQDFLQHKIKGYGTTLLTFLHLGFIYDTRDLETDPSRGTVFEITDELSLKALGSSLDFNKTFIHFNYYKKILPGTFKKVVLAYRLAAGYTMGDAPFFEYRHEWSSEEHVEGLGGGTTLRGYKQARFLARVMSFSNLELRCRFAQFKALNQHFAMSAVPFVDAGAVYDDINTIGNLNNIRYSEGLGLRIAWNVNTILRFDYAISKEDHQFFFNLAQMF